MQIFIVLLIIVGSALVASLVTIGIGRFEAARSQDSSGRLSALLVCNQLEVFGAACAEIVLEDLGYLDSKGAIGAPAVRLAAAPDYAPDISWKALGAGMANTLFNFQAQALAAQRAIATLEQTKDAETVAKDCIRHSIGLGLRAFAHAKALREAYHLPAPEPSTDWNPAVALARWHLELEPLTALLKPMDTQDDIEPTLAHHNDESNEVQSAHPLFRDAG